MSNGDGRSESAAEHLVHAGDGRMPQESGGSLRAALANAMVVLKKRHYGRLTQNEETLIADGKEALVRTYRLAFQETMKDITTAAVAELTGREVLTYHSQIAFHPTRSFEIFVLAPADD
jgi:uncharacterized protein YbcI